MITGITYVQARQDSNPSLGQMGIAVEGHPGMRPGLINEDSERRQPSIGDLVQGLTLPMMCPYGPQSRYFEIFSRGSKLVEWSVEVNEKWIFLSKSSGRLSPRSKKDDRVEISINWTEVPSDFNQVIHLHIRTVGGDYEQVHVPIVNRHVPVGFHGFIESDRNISIEVGSVPLTPEQQHAYEHHPYLGRTRSGGISLRSDSDGASLPINEIPFLEYPVYFFSDRVTATMILYITMALETNPDQLLTYDISFDDSMHQGVRLLEDPARLEIYHQDGLALLWMVSGREATPCTMSRQVLTC